MGFTMWTAGRRELVVLVAVDVLSAAGIAALVRARSSSTVAYAG